MVASLANDIPEGALDTPYRRNKYICDHIYVAYSPSIDVFKIGITKNPIHRLSTMKSVGIGGVKDWEFHCAYKVGVKTAHSHEVNISRQLYCFNVELNYLNQTSAKYSRELYKCDIKIIKAAFKSVGVIIPVSSEVLRKKFVEFVPQTNFLKWVNMNRENVGLKAMTMSELENSKFYTIPETANFS